MLAGSAVSGILGVTGLSAQIASAPKAATSNIKVSISLNGATYTYPDGPKIPHYYVGFRADGRLVFHLGALGNLSAPASTIEPYKLGPHHVRIEENGKILLEADVPAHWWNAVWTYRPAPIAVRKTPAQIVAANRMFPFGDTGCKLTAQSKRSPYTVMGSSSITVNMPQTGERPDIGLITDNSAYYMLGGDPLPMIDCALSAESCPMHFREETIGKPIDLIKYPAANSYSGPQQGRPWLLRGPMVKDRAGNPWPEFGGGWAPQQAHYCEMSYMAHVATLDPGFLEDLQYSANFTVLCDGYLSNVRRIATIFGEVRGIGWALRNLFMAHAATRDAEARGDLPATCHPSSYFKKLLDQSLIYYTANVGAQVQKDFHIWLPASDKYSPWMEEYLNTALAFGILTGNSDWLPLYLFSLGNMIARTNGTSGWPPSLCTPYRIPTADPVSKTPLRTWRQAFDALMTEPEARLSSDAHDRILANPLNGGRLAPEEPYGYHFTTRAVLVMAAHLESKGLANIRAVYPDLDTCIGNVTRMARNFGSINPRVAVVTS